MLDFDIIFKNNKYHAVTNKQVGILDCGFVLCSGGNRESVFDGAFNELKKQQILAV